MANEMIALQAQAPKVMDYADFMGIREHAQDRRAAENAMLQKQNQENAMNAAYQQAYDPATGQVDSNRLAQSLAQGGFGSQIPGAQKGLIETNKARTDLEKGKVEHILKFGELSRGEINGSASPEDLVQRMSRLAQMFPDMAPHLQQGIATMPKDPAGFAAWKQEQLRNSLTAEQRLKNHYVQQTTDSQVRVLAMPEFGNGGATVVPGSVGNAPPTPKQFIWTQNGLVAGDTRTGAATPVGGGGGAPALATNPGALKDGPFARSQPGYTGNSGGFATFASPEQGIAAQERLLTGAYLNKGFNTIDKIVNRYAPQGPENSAASVANYKAYIAQRAGIAPNAPITPDKVPAVAAAMREFETGQRPGGQIQPAPTAAQRDALGGTMPTPKVPPATANAYIANNAAMDKIREAKSAVEKYKGAVGAWNTVTPDFAAQRVDPKGVTARALIADIGSLKIHDRSGAAVTASETPRLKPFIPTVSDTPATIGRKLDNFLRELESINQETREFYSNDAGQSQFDRIGKGKGGGSVDDILRKHGVM